VNIPDLNSSLNVVCAGGACGPSRAPISGRSMRVSLMRTRPAASQRLSGSARETRRCCERTW